MWEMLSFWTQADFKTLVRERINSFTNAVYMTKNEHSLFKHFQFYLDKKVVSRFCSDLVPVELRANFFSIRISPTSPNYASSIRPCIRVMGRVKWMSISRLRRNRLLSPPTRLPQDSRCSYTKQEAGAIIVAFWESQRTCSRVARSHFRSAGTGSAEAMPTLQPNNQLLESNGFSTCTNVLIIFQELRRTVISSTFKNPTPTK
jgi:hypothetical protein